MDITRRHQLWSFCCNRFWK